MFHVSCVMYCVFLYPLSVCPPPAISSWWCRRSRRQLPSYWFLESAQTWTHYTLEPEHGGNTYRVYIHKGHLTRNTLLNHIYHNFPWNWGRRDLNIFCASHSPFVIKPHIPQCAVIFCWTLTLAPNIKAPMMHNCTRKTHGNEIKLYRKVHPD